MTDQQPTVTVIMPIRNEEDFIHRSLGAVLEQDYPADKLDVLIADGMSDDKTREIIAGMAADSAVPVRIVDNPERIVPTGLNAALNEAQGNVIVRVDGHTVIEPDYVSMCVEALLRSGYDNVGGRMDAVGETEFGQIAALVTSSPFGVGGAKFHYATEEQTVDTVYMGCWWTETVLRLGGFDERFVRSQDSEFNYRLRAHGGKILLSPQIKSTYYARGTARKLMKQYYQYGFYKVQVIFRHPTQFRARQLVPPLFVLFVLLGWVTLWLPAPLSWAWPAVVALYLGANAVFSLRIARREDQLADLPKLFLAFLIVHFSWGVGFWRGLVQVVLPGNAPERYVVPPGQRIARE